MPEVAEPCGRLPDRDLAPLVLHPGPRAFVDAPADARLQDHIEATLPADGVICRPPAADPRRPGDERVLGRAGNVEAQGERFDHRGRVFSASSLKRAAASPHTWR